MSNIHDFLKNTRIELEISIQELSKLSGVSASHISRIERSSRKPSPRTLEKLAPYLEVSYMTLLEVANLVQIQANKTIHLEEVFTHSTILFKGIEVKEPIKKQILSLLENMKEGLSE